ncbi:MAG TPA: CpsD/CapB family tyrosine-protein kinase [bacterium]
MSLLQKVSREVDSEHTTPTPFYGYPPTFSQNMVYEIQTILDNIRMADKGGSLHVIGVAASTPQEGATTIATALALFAGESRLADEAPQFGKSLQGRAARRLLVDAQFHHPTIHSVFGLPMAPGLADFLRQEAPPPSIRHDLEQLSLSVIPAGNVEKDLFGRVDSHQMRLLLGAAREEFDTIFIDLPPVLRFPESKLLSQLCDGVVLVVGSGQSRREAVEEARETLEKAEVKVLGAVLNRREFFIPAALYRLF